MPDWSGPALRDRLDHFAREDARVAESVLALRRADADTFGRLAAESQADGEVLLANQVPETSALVRVARDAGAVAARSFGAGFGGSAWAMIESAGDKDDRNSSTGGCRRIEVRVQKRRRIRSRSCRSRVRRSRG